MSHLNGLVPSWIGYNMPFQCSDSGKVHVTNFFSSWTDAICSIMEFLFSKFLSQISHLTYVSFITLMNWYFMFFFKFSFPAKLTLQIEHLNDFSLLWIDRTCWGCSFLKSKYHKSNWIFFPSWNHSKQRILHHKCHTEMFFPHYQEQITLLTENLTSHMSHLNGFFCSWRDTIWIINLVFTAKVLSQISHFCSA